MLQITKPYRHYIALLMLGLFCFVLAMHAVHAVVHHHEHKQELCNQTCDKSKAHFHEIEHELEHCSLCDFIFSFAELPDIQCFTLRSEVLEYSFSLSFYEVCLSVELCNAFSRGPPTA